MALNNPTVAKNEVEENEAIETVQQDVAPEGVVETAAQAEVSTDAGETEVVRSTVANTTSVAVAGAANKAPALNGAQFTEMAAAEGFEGMELDAFSFPVINLPAEGVFQQLGDDESDLGKWFTFQAESSRARYRVAESDDDDAEHFMSYDPNGTTQTDGTSAEPLLAQWRADNEEGWKPEVKKYLDVVATIVEADPSSEEAQDLVGETVMLSIPKSGQGRFSGVQARGLKQYGSFHEFCIVAEVGKKVKKGSNTFYPWNFKLAKQH